MTPWSRSLVKGIVPIQPQCRREKEMLKVDQYEYIRTALRVYGKKIKAIARETGHSKNTVSLWGRW
ncbi:MAG: hypothetical protein R6U40_12995 [Desulfobacterales bacterium]